jgi:hypothetical protein
MENDSIRASGTDTLVDIWVNGKLRAISISKEAIAAFVGFDRAGMSEEQRCELIRTHLPQVVAAVKIRLINTDPDADAVTLDVGQLGGASQQDRRKGDRRKTDRRKANRPKDELTEGERRRGDRRKGDRRTPKS